MSPRLRKLLLPFNGYTLPDPWKADTTETAGTPAVTMTNGGFCRLSLDATAEIQVARLSNGDVLPFDIDNLDSIEFWARCSAALNAACSLSMGVCNAGNNTIASITSRAMFRMTGGGSLTIDAVDGTHSQTAIATGMAMATSAWQRFTMNFKQNTITMGPPASHVGGVGGKASVLFGVEDTRGNLRHVAGRTQFDMSAETGNLQLYFQLQKSANAATATLDVRDVEVTYRQ
jgi:hypothetical protein